MIWKLCNGFVVNTALDLWELLSLCLYRRRYMFVMCLMLFTVMPLAQCQAASQTLVSHLSRQHVLRVTGARRALRMQDAGAGLTRGLREQGAMFSQSSRSSFIKMSKTWDLTTDALRLIGCILFAVFTFMSNFCHYVPLWSPARERQSCADHVTRLHS